jgi:hypothetical protein
MCGILGEVLFDSTPTIKPHIKVVRFLTDGRGEWRTQNARNPLNLMGCSTLVENHGSHLHCHSFRQTVLCKLLINKRKLKFYQPSTTLSTTFFAHRCATLKSHFGPTTLPLQLAAQKEMADNAHFGPRPKSFRISTSDSRSLA